MEKLVVCNNLTFKVIINFRLFATLIFTDFILFRCIIIYIEQVFCKIEKPLKQVKKKTVLEHCQTDECIANNGIPQSTHRKSILIMPRLLQCMGVRRLRGQPFVMNQGSVPPFVSSSIPSVSTPSFVPSLRLNCQSHLQCNLCYFSNCYVQVSWT